MEKQIVLFVAVLLVNLVHSTPVPDNLVVSLPNGQVQGASYSTSNGKVYYGYRGIPFARPPVGDLRYESPQPAKPWNGILNATADSPACISMMGMPHAINEPPAPQEDESEDCLYINVYVPDTQSTQSLPVMVWIYGGGFGGGSAAKSQYGPDYLVEKDVIFVSLNYRLGPLGFLSTADSAITGNFGLKDQRLGLEWVRDNIGYFGGDPEKVTLFGQSAGAISTCMHLVSKRSAGLFRAAIVESGSAVHIDSVYQNPREIAFRLGKELGNSGNDSQALKQFLKSKTAEEISSAAASLQAGQVFVPTIEIDSQDAVTSESPYGILERGDFHKVPLIIGLASEEGLMFLQNLENAQAQAIAYDKDQSKVVPTDLYPNSEAEAIQAIKEAYLIDGETFATNITAFVKYFSDNQFPRSILKHANLASRWTTVYLYEFAYYGRAHIVPFVDGIEKASHGAEIPFLFPQNDADADKANLLMQEKMTTLWTNFAKYLNPTPETSDLFDNLIWPVHTEEENQYFDINGTLSIATNLKGQAMASWEDIYDTYGRKPYVTF